MTIQYIFSQVIVVLAYVCLILSYQVKTRNKILICSLLALTFHSIAYILLGAYTGLAMSIVAILRNIIFMIDEKKNGKNAELKLKDFVILIVLYVITIVSSVYTYNGPLSLLSVIATMLYTYSVWQKNTKVYKIVGIPVEALWIAYNIYIKSIMGVILEVILAISIFIGYYKEIKNQKN